MSRFFLRWLINAVALYAAVALVPGITAQSTNWLSFLWLALIFGLLNALLRPLLKLLTCPLILLTLGLFTLVINTFLFWLAGLVGTNFGVGFTVDGFWPAFWGGLMVSVVSVALTLLFKEDKKK
ncbi:MAG: phage holin family protein [Anaerolineales bacterium]|nr:phage holin family protein [Anaerolineales bacterium]MCX7755942.1 phage holin family protein [Anaerolineales bacterium]MDW8276872.1 phage holin family protein [Anaerolineales bacterium]